MSIPRTIPHFSEIRRWF